MSERRRETRQYVIGLGMAAFLSTTAFSLAVWPIAGRTATVAAIFVLGLIQAIVHFRCFLHIGLGRSSRHDLILLLFSGLIVLLMVSGTLVVLANLAMRMH